MEGKPVGEGVFGRGVAGYGGVWWGVAGRSNSIAQTAQPKRRGLLGYWVMARDGREFRGVAGK